MGTTQLINLTWNTMETAQFRELFPEITDEQIAQRVSEQKEKKKQSLRDRIANLAGEQQALENELENLDQSTEEVAG